jgi:hypothetical protein
VIALLAVLAAAPGCEGLEERTAALTVEAIAEVERALGAPLVLPGEPAEEHVALARVRWREACALLERPARRGAPDRPLLEQLFTREELARARVVGGNPLQELLERLGTWLKSMLLTGTAQTFAEGARFAVLAVASFLALGGVLWAASRWGGRRRKASAPAPRAPGALELQDPVEHLARARARLSGDSREAIREGLLALLSALERRSWARPDRVKTNRELAAELPRRGAPAETSTAVEELLRWYDRTFYSLEPVPPAEAAQFVERVERLRQGMAG